MTTAVCEKNEAIEQPTQAEGAVANVAGPPPSIWERPYIGLEFKPESQTAHLEVSAWTETITPNPYLRQQLIEEPLLAEVRAAIAGSERRGKYRKLLRQRWPIEDRRATAAKTIHKLKAEREYVLAAQDEGFAARIVVIDAEIPEQERELARAEAELAVIDPLVDAARADAEREVAAAAVQVGQRLMSEIRQRAEGIRGELAKRVQPLLDECAQIAQLLSLTNLRYLDFRYMAKDIVAEADPSPQPQGELVPEVDAPTVPVKQQIPSPEANDQAAEVQEEAEATPKPRARPLRQTAFDLDM